MVASYQETQARSGINKNKHAKQTLLPTMHKQDLIIAGNCVEEGKGNPDGETPQSGSKKKRSK